MWARLKQQIWQWRGVLITAPSLAGIIITLRSLGALQLLELAALDQFFRLRPLEPADPRIVIVTIDESDITKLGQWPMSDAVLAELLKQLKQQQPRAIGLDLYRNLPIEPGHQELVKVFKSTPNLIGVKKVIGNAYSDGVEPPPTLSQLDRVGASDLILDVDGKLRRNLVYLKDRQNQTVLSLGTKLALTYLKTEGITLQVVDAGKIQLRLKQAVLVPLKANDGGYSNADVGGYQIVSNFRRLQQSFRTVSMTAVLEGRIPPELVRDRIILIGYRAESLRDRFYTPYSTSPVTALTGVEVHADLASQLLATALEGRPLLRVWSQPLEWLWIVAWSLVGASLAWTLPSPRWTAISVLLFGSALFGGAYILFLEGWWLIVISPLLALAGSTIVSSGYRLWENLKLSHQQLKDYARTLEQAEQVSRGQTEALVKTLTVLAAEPVLDNFLGCVLQAIVEQLGDRAGGLWLYDQDLDTTVLHIEYENGQIRRTTPSEHLDASRPNIPWHWNTNYMQLLQEKKVLIQDLRQYPDSPEYFAYRTHHEKRGAKTILVIALSTDETFLGTITVQCTPECNYKPEAIELAHVLAHQATLAIQLTRLAEQSRHKAVLEERNRMAREIHDTIAQGLAGIIVQLQAASDSYITDPNERQEHITQACLLAKNSLAEARRSVQALRPQVLEQTDLCGAFKHFIKQTMMGTNVQSTCHVSGLPYPLPPLVESNLLRIGQEAFTNSLKHAHASEVKIEIVYEPTQVLLRVQDNGYGFDPEVPSKGSFGLIGMRERAQSIGAMLTLVSQLGHGTTVAVTVPVVAQSTQRSSP